MSFDEARIQRNGSSVIQAMLRRLAEEEREEAAQEKAPELPLGRKTVGTVPVETAKPLAEAALY